MKNGKKEAENKRRKWMQYIRRILAVILCVVLSTGGIAPRKTVSLAAEQDFAPEEQSAGGGVTLDNILCPDSSGQYSYTYENAEIGKRYAFLVVSGIYESLDAADMDKVSANLLYIDQKTSEGTQLSFDGFIPVYTENSTVILSAEDGQPMIAGYISKDILKAGYYVSDTNKSTPLNDTLTIQKNTSWTEFKQTLPTSCYMEVCSDYMPQFYREASLTWRDCKDFNSAKAGNTFQITADVSLSYDAPDILKTLVKPFTATVIVQDAMSVPESITAVKAKAVYQEGDPLSDADVQVRAIYSDGTVRDVTGWTSDINELSSAEPGIRYLTITYTEAEITLQTQLSIMIVSTGQPDTEVFQITFETFGGTYISARFVEAGNTLGTIPEPVKSGFVFTGWYTDRNRQNPYDTQLQIDRDMTLYAGWQSADECVLEELKVILSNYNLKLGETLTEDMIEVKALYSDGTSKAVENFTHDLKDIDQSTAGSKTVHIRYTEDGVTKEGSAVFRIIAADTQTLYTVGFHTGCEQVIKAQNVAAGEKLTEPGIVLVREGYVFAGWELDGIQWDFAADVVERDIVLKAKWLKKQGNADFYCYVDEEQDYVYTGKAWKPSVVIQDKNFNTLRPNKDYSVKYVNNVQVSAGSTVAKAVITGKGNYAGTVEVPFNILAKDIADETAVSMKLNRCNPYKKAGYNPVPVGKYNGKALKNNKDFIVSYQKLGSYDSESGTNLTETVIKDAGWYLVTVTGKGNYTGSRTFRFEIAPAGVQNLGSASLKLDKAAANVPYTGNPVTINGAVALSFGKTSLIEGEDYTLDYQGDNTSIGKKQVIARALPQSTRCYGEKIIYYNITGLSMKQAIVCLKNKNIGYTGTFISDNVENVTLKLDKKTAAILNAYYGGSLSDNDTYILKENMDYTVSYRKNENAGKAVIIFTGKGLFSGKIESSFTIDKIDLNDSNVTATLQDNSVKQNKSGAVTAVKLIYATDSRQFTLREGTDYTVSYTGNKAAGANAMAVITGKGNFKGSITKNFTIEKKALTVRDIRISVINPVKVDKKSDYIYKPKVMVYDGGALLKENLDYTVDYSKCITQENVSGGKTNGYLIIRAKENGSYSGARTVVYQVQPYNIADKKCTITIADQTYTGKAVEFDLDNAQGRSAFQAKMTLDGNKTVDLVPGEDFEIVSYSRNTTCGTAQVVIKGTGSYGGSRTVKFKIVKQKLQP